MKVKQRGRKIDFIFEDETMAPEARMVTFDADRVHSGLHEQAEMHGWIQRLRDNAAIARKDKDGNVITVTEAMRKAAVKELIDHYHSGSAEWNVKARAVIAENPVWRALADKRGVAYEVIAAEKAAADLAELEAMA